MTVIAITWTRSSTNGTRLRWTNKGGTILANFETFHDKLAMTVIQVNNTSLLKTNTELVLLENILIDTIILIKIYLPKIRGIFKPEIPLFFSTGFAIFPFRFILVKVFF